MKAFYKLHANVVTTRYIAYLANGNKEYFTISDSFGLNYYNCYYVDHWDIYRVGYKLCNEGMRVNGNFIKAVKVEVIDVSPLSLIRLIETEYLFFKKRPYVESNITVTEVTNEN